MKVVYDFTKFVTEQLTYHKTLNPTFWKEDEFDSETRKKLLQIANDFYDDLKVDAPIVDVYLIGSMVNYSWSQYSDLDVHVVLDFSKVDSNVELVADALNGKKFMWNLRHPVVIKGYDVELYVQDINHKHISAGTYSLMKGEWLTKPKWDPPTVDMEYVEEKVRLYEREIVEVDKMMDEHPDSEDAKSILNRVKLLKKKITKARDASLQKDGEFSIENLVFKELRHTGWIKKLIDLGAKAYSAIYSDKPVNIGDETELTEKTSKVKQFGQFVTEVLSYDDAAKERIASEMADIDTIADLGLISPEVVRSKKLQIVKLSGDPEALTNDPILGPIIASEIFKAVKSEPWKKLQEMGYVFSSNYKQVINGTFVMTTLKALGAERKTFIQYYGNSSTKTNKNPVSLAIYPSLVVRRLNKGDRPGKLLDMSNSSIDVNSFYEYALNWIINKIDETDVDLSSRSRTKNVRTNEVINYDEDTKQRLATELSELQALLDLNLIPITKFNAKRSEILRKSGDHEALVNDPVLGPVIASDVFKALNSEEWDNLQKLGYKCISTYRQIMNGTIELTTDLAIRTKEDRTREYLRLHPGSDVEGYFKARGIAIFSTGYVRQMNVGQNPIIAKYDFGGLEMYKAAMNLIADKIAADDGYLNTKRSLAIDKKRELKGDVLLTKLLKRYEHFDLLPEEIDRLIAPNVKEIFKYNSISDINDMVKNMNRVLNLNVLALFGRVYVDEIMTPELERIITERQLTWTNVTRVSSWSAQSPPGKEGGTMSTTFIFLNLEDDLTNNTKGCTFSAMKYYVPTQVNDVGGNCSNRGIDVYLPRKVALPPYCLDGFKNLDSDKIYVEYKHRNR